MGKMNNHFYIKESTVKKIEEYKEKHHLKKGEALDEIVERFFERDSNLAQEISNIIINDLSKILTRVRLGVNNADRNSQIMIELLNTLFIHHKIPRAIPTTDYNNKTDALLEAEMTVKKRIEGFVNKNRTAHGND